MKSKNNISQIADVVNSVLQKINEEENETIYEIRKKQICVDKNFEITHREYVAMFFGCGSDTIGKVKAHIVRNTRIDCGLYFGSITKTSEQTGVSRRTVVSIFNALQYDDLIRLYKYGIWAVNPKFLRKGNSGKYVGQLRFYNSLPKKVRPKKEEEFEEDDCKLSRKLRVIK